MNTEKDIFELATRQKLRFGTAQGQIGVEDLWDLPLQAPPNRPNAASLDAIAVDLSKQLKNEEPVSFVNQAKKSVEADLIKLKFDVVMHILNVKKAEREEALSAKAKADQRQKIMEIINRKENQALEDLPADQLKAMLDDLK